MEYSSTHKKDQRTSAIITFIISLVVLLCLYFYKFTRITPASEEVVTTMLINFGDNTNGNATEEPAPEEGSLASQNTIVKETTQVKQTSSSTISEPKTKTFTGNDTKRSVTKTPEKSSSKQQKSSSVKKTQSKTSSKASSSKTNTSKNGKGDGKGTAAIGNLLRGRGSKKGSQGNGGNTGNAGDPLGGSGNGDSKIGVDRKLIAFIPGTMGRGGTQPKHNCSASGEIQIAYTVDRIGRVTSAKRISGISDPCAVKTTVDWVKRYVKAEKGTSSSTGTYSIKF